MKIQVKRVSLIIMVVTLITTLCITAVTFASSSKTVKLSSIKSGTTVSIGSKTPTKVKTNVKSKVSYKSSNKKVAYVSKGKIVAKKAGTIKITITAKPTSKKYKAVKKSITIKVRPAKPKTIIANDKNVIKAYAKKVTGASKYKIRYSTSSNFKNAKTKTVKTNQKISIIPKPNTVYYVKSQAVSGKYVSSWSNTVKVTVGNSTSNITIPTTGSNKPATCNHTWVDKQVQVTASYNKTVVDKKAWDETIEYEMFKMGTTEYEVQPSTSDNECISQLCQYLDAIGLSNKYKIVYSTPERHMSSTARSLIVHHKEQSHTETVPATYKTVTTCSKCNATK